MVANITSGADFADMVAYALGRDEPDKKAQILCASDGILLTDTEDYRTVARLFEAYSLRGDHQLRDPLKHISLSWHARDGTSHEGVHETDGYRGHRVLCYSPS